MDLKDRLFSITKKDKEKRPEFLLEVIKSDFFYLISNYFEVDFNDISVTLNQTDNKFNIEISCLGDRLKLMRNLPQ